MTREEAIKRIIDIRKIYAQHVEIVTENENEALDMAINALEQLSIYERTIIILTNAISEQEPKTIQERQAESEKYQKAFEDGYEQGYAQARFDYEQEPCEDAISRQTVINAIANTCFWLSSDNWKELIKCINSIPLVKPQEPKIGHWEWVQYDYNSKLGNWHCSECRCIVVECVNKEEKGGIPLYKYCPQCGTKMVELQKSEGKE